MRNCIGVLFLILFSLNSFAQGESFGSNSSNYSGVNSVLLNPSAMHNQKTWLSFNFLSGNLFFHTDFAYLDKSEFQLSDLLDPNFELPAHPTEYGINASFYSYDRERNTSFDQNVRILGPSLMVSYNQHAFAITTAARMQTNLRKITPDLANLLAYGFAYSPQFGQEYQVNDLNITSMGWTEIGLSYAYKVDNESDEGLSFGISIKRLLGAGGAYLDVDRSTYALVDTNIVEVTNQQAEIGISVPVDYETNDFIDFNLLNGRGWSFDIGFTYQLLLESQPKLDARRFCEQPIINYKYRIGVALLDIGSIAYKQNTQTHRFNTFALGQGRGDFNGVESNSINEFFGILSYHFYNDSSASFVGNTMRIALPTALSIQGDYNTQISDLYINASLIYGIPLQGSGALRRPSQLTIAPRYETSYLELSIPLSLYKFRYPHIGVYARIGPVGFGSDWLSSLIGKKDFHGMDFYFSAKFHLAKGNCRSRKSKIEGCGDKSGRFRWGF